MSNLIPATTVLAVDLYLESNGTLLLMLNDHEAGHFNLEDLVREALEETEGAADSHAEYIDDLKGLNRHLARALVQVTQKLGPLLQEATEDGDLDDGRGGGA